MFLDRFRSSLCTDLQEQEFCPRKKEQETKELGNWAHPAETQPDRDFCSRLRFLCQSWGLLCLWGGEVQLLSSLPSSSKAILILASHELSLLLKMLFEVLLDLFYSRFWFSVVIPYLGSFLPFTSLRFHTKGTAGHQMVSIQKGVLELW